MGDGKLALDWGMGENLAYASLLVQGFEGMTPVTGMFNLPAENHERKAV